MNQRSVIWTKRRIIDAMLDYNDQYGHPPATPDWNPSLAKHFGDDDRAARFYQDDIWPTVSTVQLRFGSWSKALKAAGFAPHPVGPQAHRKASSVE